MGLGLGVKVKYLPVYNKSPDVPKPAPNSQHKKQKDTHVAKCPKDYDCGRRYDFHRSPAFRGV